MRIIQATLEHLDLLSPLFVKYREFYGELPFPESSRSFLEKRLRREESVIYLALHDEDDSKLLGFCQLYPSYSSLSLKRVWILNDIYVAEDARRQLVADHLIKSAKRWPRNHRPCACVCPPAATTPWHKRSMNQLVSKKIQNSRTTCYPSARVDQIPQNPVDRKSV